MTPERIAELRALCEQSLEAQSSGTHLHQPCTSYNDCPACRLRRCLSQTLELLDKVELIGAELHADVERLRRGLERLRDGTYWQGPYVRHLLQGTYVRYLLDGGDPDAKEVL